MENGKGQRDVRGMIVRGIPQIRPPDEEATESWQDRIIKKSSRMAVRMILSRQDSVIGFFARPTDTRNHKPRIAGWRGEAG
jgi:hypothetical protein